MSAHPHPDVRTVRIGTVDVGSEQLWLVAGPCAVETRDGIIDVAHGVRTAGAAALRGGAFKPRTSPHSFQGLGRDGIDLLVQARAHTGLPIVTEILDPRDVADVAPHVDVIQVGARNMANGALLREVATAGLPVLLKRGFGATVDELLHAAEYILDAGNPDVVLCERGIRSFENTTRFTLDIAAVPVLRARTHLPIIVDPSHAAGHAALVQPLALAAIAAGADGLMVEVHHDPDNARSDGRQSLTIEEFHRLIECATPVATAVGRTVRHVPTASTVA